MGSKGIFRGVKDFAFRNRSGCLGSFGFLSPPGEMLFVAVPLVSEMQKGRKSLALANISHPTKNHGHSSSSSLWRTTEPSLLGLHPKDWHCFLREFDTSGLTAPFSFGSLFGFLGNVRFARDLYDLTRAYTQLGIGELTRVGD